MNLVYVSLMLYCKIFWLLTFKAKRVGFRAMDLYGYI
jgi:hypothetical protein